VNAPRYVLMVWCLIKHRDNFIFRPITQAPNSMKQSSPAKLTVTYLAFCGTLVYGSELLDPALAPK